MQSNARKLEANAQYRAAHAEKIKAAEQKYRAANREKIAERHRLYYAENGDRLRARKRELYQASSKVSKVECPLCRLYYGRAYLPQHMQTRHKLPPTTVQPEKCVLLVDQTCSSLDL